MGIMYEDFLDLDYESTDEDLVYTFRTDPMTRVLTEAATNRMASESSSGTWATLQTNADFTDVNATAFDTGDSLIRVAYPAGLFKPDNMLQVLSYTADGVMGMKAADTIHLLDCEWPESIVLACPGPLYGSSVCEEIFGITGRPIATTMPKPKVGPSMVAHARINYDAWAGGTDLLEDDENLANQAFNPFSDRLTESLPFRDDVEDETSREKSYPINIVTDTQTTLDRADEVAIQGGKYVTVDIITAGWASLQTVRERTEKHSLTIHTHRAMHAAFDRLPAHGVPMQVLTQVSRLCGVDQLHAGTVGLGKPANEDTAGINEWFTDDLHGATDTLPVTSGGPHSGLLPNLLSATGTSVCVQLGGGVHSHSDGARMSAVALRPAIGAYVERCAITEAAEEAPEFAVALNRWGAETLRQAGRNGTVSSRSRLLLLCNNGLKRVE